MIKLYLDHEQVRDCKKELVCQLIGNIEERNGENNCKDLGEQQNAVNLVNAHE